MATNNLRTSDLTDNVKTSVCNHVNKNKVFSVKNVREYITTNFKLRVTKGSVHQLLHENNIKYTREGTNNLYKVL